MYWRVLFSCLDDYDDYDEYFDYNDYNDYDKGSLRIRKVQFFNIVQKAFDKPPPPFRLNIYVVNSSEGILTKVRKRLSHQLFTK